MSIKSILAPIKFPFVALGVTAVFAFTLGWTASNLFNRTDTVSFEVTSLGRDILAIEKCKVEAESVSVDEQADEAIEIGGTYEEVMLTFRELKENKQAQAYKDCIDKL